ncbi:MAG: DUF4177 domain-containing protein [Luteimonas sp.]
MSERWQYKVHEIKPGLFGLKASQIEENLQALGQQGWELVNAVHISSMMPTLLFLKRRA